MRRETAAGDVGAEQDAVGPEHGHGVLDDPREALRPGRIDGEIWVGPDVLDAAHPGGGQVSHDDPDLREAGRQVSHVRRVRLALVLARRLVPAVVQHRQTHRLCQVHRRVEFSAAGIRPDGQLDAAQVAIADAALDLTFHDCIVQPRVQAAEADQAPRPTVDETHGQIVDRHDLLGYGLVAEAQVPPQHHDPPDAHLVRETQDVCHLLERLLPLRVGVDVDDTVCHW